MNSLKNFKISHDGISIELDYKEDIDIIKVKFTTSQKLFKNEKSSVLQEDFSSQAQNGVKAFEVGCGNLITSNETAKAIAQKLINNYSKGKTYIESTWIGSPQMHLGTVFNSHAVNDSTQTYECLSNEFTITGGMRLKTKARQK